MEGAMILWIFMLPFSLAMMLVCYPTNPIAVLFCDENGELRGIWKMWQTWDNSCNPSDVTEHRQLPSFLLYDWPRHYKESYDTTPELKRVGRKRWFTVCIDSNWTIWERIKRYICRAYWLMRNSCYGWAFWAFGITPGIRWVTVQNDGETQFVHEDYDWWWLDGAWRYKSTAPICTIFGWTIRWNILLGWKVDESARVDTRAMIANRIALSFHKEGK